METIELLQEREQAIIDALSNELGGATMDKVDCPHTTDYQVPNKKGGWDVRCSTCNEYLTNII